MLSKEASNQGADKRRANRRLGNDEMEVMVRIDLTIMKLRMILQEMAVWWWMMKKMK